MITLSKNQRKTLANVVAGLHVGEIANDLDGARRRGAMRTINSLIQHGLLDANKQLTAKGLKVITFWRISRWEARR